MSEIKDVTDFEAQAYVDGDRIEVAKVMQTNSGDVIHVGHDVNSVMGYWSLTTDIIRRFLTQMQEHDGTEGTVDSALGVPLVYDGEDYWIGKPDWPEDLSFRVTEEQMKHIIHVAEKIEPQIDKRTL